MTMKIVLAGGTVYTPFKKLNRADIKITGKKITVVREGRSAGAKGQDSELVIDVRGKTVIPGLIDVHMHGGFGWDAGECPPSEDILKKLARRGTTSLLATLYPCGRKKMISVIRAYKKFLNSNYEGARILGLHMEGPFLNPELGAQRPELCEVPKRDGFKIYLKEAKDILSMMTLSPELDGSVELIRGLKARGIIPSTGHSAAGEEILKKSRLAGLRHATHIFNATRRPESELRGIIKTGMDEFCLLHDDISCEIVADSSKIHVNDTLLGLAWKCKGPDKLIIISDSTTVAGLPPGRYEWNGRRIIVGGSDVGRLENGDVAGSAMTVIDALRNIMKRLSLPLEKALLTATVNPAKLLGIERSKGGIAPGMDADLIVVDESLKVYLSIVEGKIMYKDKSIRIKGQNNPFVSRYP